ncbi:hypothetical protein N7465_006540 [Penicillium sp. CMV-2018d]|nr:hypothetical protein N7465_006540 [Penicillium sp. CMV-2018d]
MGIIHPTGQCAYLLVEAVAIPSTSVTSSTWTPVVPSSTIIPTLSVEPQSCGLESTIFARQLETRHY